MDAAGIALAANDEGKPMASSDMHDLNISIMQTVNDIAARMRLGLLAHFQQRHRCLLALGYLTVSFHADV